MPIENLRSTLSSDRRLVVARRVLAQLLSVLALALLCAGLQAEPGIAEDAEPVLALVGGTLHLGDGSVLEDSVVLLRGDLVDAVGVRGDVELPADCPTRDVAGLHLTPGWIALRSAALLAESETRSGQSVRDFPLVDALDAYSDELMLEVEDARGAGITTVAVTGALSGGISSPGLVLELRQRDPAAGDLTAQLLHARDTHIALSLTTSAPVSTSAGRLARYNRVRDLFRSARKYGKRQEDYWKSVDKYNEAAKKFNEAAEKAEREKKEPKRRRVLDEDGDSDTADEEKKKEPPRKKDPPKKKEAEKKPKQPSRPGAPSRSLSNEALLQAMSGELPVLVDAHRADEIDYALRLKEEFGLRLAIVGGARARERAGALASAGVPVVLTPVLLSESSLELRGHSEDNAQTLDAAGVAVAIAPRSARPGNLAHLALEVAVAVRGGLAPEKALSAVTLEAAKVLGIDEQVGSIAAGKRANIVLFDGPPHDARSRVVDTLVVGRSVGREEAARSIDIDDAARWPAGPEEAPELLEEPHFGDVPLRVLRNARVVTWQRGASEARVIEGADVVLRGGRIASVTAGKGEVPKDAVVEDLDGAWVLPGFIDAHTHLGVDGAVDDISHAVQEDFRLLDGFDPWHPRIGEWLRRGVTSVALSPGSDNVVSGEVALIKLRPARVPVRVVARHAAWKTSLAPELNAQRFPTSASGAQTALTSWWTERTARTQPVDLALVHFETLSSAQRMLDSVLRSWSPDSALRPVFIEGPGSDAETFRRLASPFPVILGPYTPDEPARVLSAPRALEGHQERGPQPARTDETLYAFSTAGTRADLLTTATLSIRHGIRQDEALKALTLAPADIYGQSGRLGVIAAEADADLCVWSGNPFTLNARLLRVYVDGELLLADGRLADARIDALPKPGASPDRDQERAATDADEGPLFAAPVEDDASAYESSDGGRLYLARRVLTVSSAPIDRGFVIVRDGKIARVGAQSDLGDADRKLDTVEVDGVLAPGLIDAGSTIGLAGRTADEFRELTPSIRAVDGLDHQTPDRRRALLAGVTCVAVTPGARNVVGGLGGVVKTSPGAASVAGSRLPRRGEVRPPYRLVSDDAFLALSLNSEADDSNRTVRSGRPTSYFYRIPTTRMGTIFLARRALLEASIEGEISELNPVSGLSPQLRADERDILRAVLDGSQVLRVRADTHSEIRAALRLGEEFGVTVHIEGAREALQLVGEIRAAGASVIAESGEQYSEAQLEASAHLGARSVSQLVAAGVAVCFGSGSGSSVPSLRESVARQLRYGLSPEDALRCLTANAARVLGVDEKLGSIEPGRDADLVAFSGDPLEWTSDVLWVLVDGQRYDHALPEGSPASARSPTP